MSFVVMERKKGVLVQLYINVADSTGHVFIER